jgi:hypothetical protein
MVVLKWKKSRRQFEVVGKTRRGDEVLLGLAGAVGNHNTPSIGLSELGAAENWARVQRTA